MIGSPAIGDPVTLGIKKPDKAFQNRLRQIHENVKSVGGDVLGNSTYGHNITEWLFWKQSWQLGLYML